MVKNGSASPPLQTLVEHWLLLRRVATVASKEDRQQVDGMKSWFDDVAALDVLLEEDARPLG